jgi:hypothetical protein
MNQVKNVMSKSYMRAARKKQHSEFMKQQRVKTKAYNNENAVKIEDLRNGAPAHDFNNLDS